MTKMIRAREGDFVETFEGLIFDVKGLIHPPDRVIAYVRYIPSKKGERKRKNGKFYKKIYSLDERNKFLSENYPEYIYFDPVFNQLLEGVPIKNIYKHYKPEGKLREMRLGFQNLTGIEKVAFEFAKLLKEKSGIPWTKIGISGSLLVDLYNENSDIDIIIYGTSNGMKVYEVLKKLVSLGTSIKSYDESGLKKLYKFRVKNTEVSFEQFAKIEERKIMQGEFKGVDYFLRFVKDWYETAENYGEKIYIPVGRARIKAQIINNDEAIFTPCRYLIDDVSFLQGNLVYPLTEIVSFRGRFCEQARVGEHVVAQGTVEKILRPNDNVHHYRLILGGNPEDFMILAEEDQ